MREDALKKSQDLTDCSESVLSKTLQGIYQVEAELLTLKIETEADRTLEWLRNQQRKVLGPVSINRHTEDPDARNASRDDA